MQKTSFFLNKNDVVATQDAIEIEESFVGQIMPSTFCVHELKHKVESYNVTGIEEEAFECRVLCHDRLGWRDGKIKVRIEIEFQPNEPDSNDTFEELRLMNSEEEAQ